MRIAIVDCGNCTPDQCSSEEWKFLLIQRRETDEEFLARVTEVASD